MIKLKKKVCYNVDTKKMLNQDDEKKEYAVFGRARKPTLF